MSSSQLIALGSSAQLFKRTLLGVAPVGGQPLFSKTPVHGVRPITDAMARHLNRETHVQVQVDCLAGRQWINAVAADVGPLGKAA